jgi:hypothetical protein
MNPKSEEGQLISKLENDLPYRFSFGTALDGDDCEYSLLRWSNNGSARHCIPLSYNNGFWELCFHEISYEEIRSLISRKMAI